jgi:hypothetical protein
MQMILGYIIIFCGLILLGNDVKTWYMIHETWGMIHDTWYINYIKKTILKKLENITVYFDNIK